MDSTESTVEISEEELLEPLIITEDGDLTETVPEGDTTSSLDVVLQSCTEESAVKKKEEHSEEDEKKEAVASERYSEEQLNTVDVHKAEADEPAGDVNRNDGQNTDAQEDHRVEIKRFHSFERKIQRNDDQDEDAKKAHRLTPDFPEALYDLLCTLQEGRRLNDQRCSFRLEDGITRRRCHSEPNTRKPANRVVFSSMTSLQKEEFFDLVATAQARRLDDQRAQLGRSAAPKPKGRSFRGSLKQLSIVKKPEPVPAPKEDLYDMILTTQAQGRLEDQRSRAPGPMDDEDFFSLLLRVQGGRMDEQRTELPCLLQT